MVVYDIDFKGVTDFWGFYRVIIKALDLPYWCGRNASAIWDMLTGYIDYPDVIRFHNFNSLPKDLDVLKPKTIKVFEDAATYYDDEQYVFEIVD